MLNFSAKLISWRHITQITESWCFSRLCFTGLGCVEGLQSCSVVCFFMGSVMVRHIVCLISGSSVISDNRCASLSTLKQWVSGLCQVEGESENSSVVNDTLLQSFHSWLYVCVIVGSNRKIPHNWYSICFTLSISE